MKIAIVGVGFVGSAYRRLFLRGRGYSLCLIDIDSYRWEEADTPGVAFETHSPAYGESDARVKEACECGLVFLCLPTERADTSDDQSAPELSALEWWLTQLAGAKYKGVVVIKSTVPPGFTAALRNATGLRLVHSPEYVGAMTYHTPSQYPHPTDLHTHRFVILGGADSDTQPVQQAMLPIMGPGCEFCFCTSTESELTKYIVNSWGAMKVVMWGEYSEMASALGVNFANVRTLALKDTRIEPMHTAVFDDKLGFANSHCFVKDMAALAHLADEVRVPMVMVKSAIARNREWREERDGK